MTDPAVSEPISAAPVSASYNAASGAGGPDVLARVGYEAGRVGEGLLDFGRGALDLGVGIAGVFADAARDPAGNGWMQGLGAMMSFVLAWKATEALGGFLPGPLRLIAGLGVGALVAFGVATAIGTARDDAQWNASHQSAAPRAADDPRLRVPDAPGGPVALPAAPPASPVAAPSGPQ